MSTEFRVFVSSTFDDLHAERDALRTFVFPRLRELAMRHGARFKAIDLRWGVDSEAGLDHRTIPICFAEVDRSVRAPPPNFIVLLGDRYGARIPPPLIPGIEFQAIRRIVSREAGDLLDSWYLGDENAGRLAAKAGAPDRYLRPRAQCMEAEDWVHINRRLCDALAAGAVAAPLSDNDLAKYTQSLTEQEIHRGVLASGSRNGALAFFRGIHNLDQATAMADVPELLASFTNLTPAGHPDARARRNLDDLKARLRQHLGTEKVYEYDATWVGNAHARSVDRRATRESDRFGPITYDHIGWLPPTLDGCLELAVQDDLAEADELANTGRVRPVNLCRDVFRRLASLVQPKVGTIAASDPLGDEIRAHQAFAAARRSHFTGRANSLAALEAYTSAPDGHIFAIVGEPGTGKSALLAEAAHRTCAIDAGPIVVSRFIGATPASTDERSLVGDLCRELQRVAGATATPINLEDLGGAFSNSLELASRHRPLVLFLDALDQLTHVLGKPRLPWLPALLPANVAIVVSTLPGPYARALVNKRATIEALQPMSRGEGQLLLEAWLHAADRTLQPDQWQAILPDDCHDVRPLWLKLAFGEARLWKSYTKDASQRLPREVSDLVTDTLFRRLSHEHGSELVSRTLAYLAAAKNGVAEDELLDLLAADSILTELQDRSSDSPITTELPATVWSRLFFDLEPYLTKRSADNSQLLTFYHRQLDAIAAATYLAGESRPVRHRELADYFSPQPSYWAHPHGTDTSPNLRKMSELAFHLAGGGLWEAASQILTDITFLSSKTACQSVDSVLDDLSLCAPQVPQILSPVQNVVEREAHHLRNAELVRSHTFFAQQVHNRAVASGFGRLAQDIREHLAALEGTVLLLRWRTRASAASHIREFRPRTSSGPKWTMSVTPDALSALLGRYFSPHSSASWAMRSESASRSAVSARSRRASSNQGP